MKISYSIILILSFIILNSFKNFDKYPSEYSELQKFEKLALKRNVIGKTYVYDLTKNKECNKTKIKYLGLIKTSKHKQYKILSSFFVFSAAFTCHGTSNIKIYDMENNYIGKYNVSMPYDLPEKLKGNKLVWADSKDCNLREQFSINLKNGLPKHFILPCDDFISFE